MSGRWSVPLVLAANELARTGAELALGDLRDPASLDRSLRGVRAIVATANVVAPSQRGDTHKAVEGRSYGELIERAAQGDERLDRCSVGRSVV